MRLTELAGAIGARVAGGEAEVKGIAMDSRAVSPGDLFVAIQGAHENGARFVPSALERGAVAVCATEPVRGTPTIVTSDPRSWLGPLSAHFYGYPGREVALVGITGSLGKTSTSLMASAVLAAAGIPAGVIGSLGIRFGGRILQTGMTTPEAPAIHRALRDMVDDGARIVVMEVTSHSLLLRRVGGIELAAGALTNVVPDEHLEFHPTPEHYIRTKARLFQMLGANAPLVVNVDDPVARQMTRSLQVRVVDVSTDGAAEADVIVQELRLGEHGSTFVLRVRRELPGLNGGTVAPCAIPIALPILGRQQVSNAVVAATVGLIGGAPAAAVSQALGKVEPMPRRMQIVHRAPIVLDDTVGNPESIRAVFEAAAAIPHERLRVAYAIRGKRGTTINQRNAETLAEMVAGHNAALVVTSSEGAADERNVVAPEEREATIAALRSAGVSFHYEERLDDAVSHLLRDAGTRDLLLLLGAQGMDRGAELARRHLSGAAEQTQR